MLNKCHFNLVWRLCSSSANRNEKFEITDTKLYVPVITLSAEDNLKPPDQLKSCFKRAINWNKYQSKVSPEKQNQYLDFLINLSFQGVNILFVLLYENEDNTKVRTGYYLPKIEKHYNSLIDGNNLFDQLFKSNIRTYKKTCKISWRRWLYKWLFNSL